MKSRLHRFPSSFAAIWLASVSAAFAQSSGKEEQLQQGNRTAAADEWRFSLTPYLLRDLAQVTTSSSVTNKYCDLDALIGWQFNDGVLRCLGYRARGQWEDDSNNDTTAEGWFFGPEVGLSWPF